MKKYENKVYLTFQTDRLTSELLKVIAHKIGKTQPELINAICESYIENILEIIEEKELKAPATPNQSQV